MDRSHLRPPRQAAVPQNDRGLTVAIVGLLALHPLGTYLFLPALPLVAARHGGSAEAAHWSLSAFVLGFGATQLLWGALADRWGRRRMLLWGLACHVVASALCLVATELEQLIALRLLQGTGVAAAGIGARTILRDRDALEACVHRLSSAFSWLSLIGIVGPPCAASLAQLGGLPALFGVSTAVGLAMLIWAARCLPESQPAVPSARLAALTAMGEVASHPMFRAYSALTACSYAGHYLFLAGSSALLVGRLGMGLIDYGWLLSAGSAVHMAGTFACRHSVAVRGVRATVCGASLLGLLGGSGMAAAALTGGESAWAVALPYAAYLFAHAIHQSCGQAAVMAPFSHSAGLAAGLNGTVLPLVAVVVGTALSQPLAHSGTALPLGVAACASLTALVAWLGVRVVDHRAVSRLRGPRRAATLQ